LFKVALGKTATMMTAVYLDRARLATAPCVVQARLFFTSNFHILIMGIRGARYANFYF